MLSRDYDRRPLDIENDRSLHIAISTRTFIQLIVSEWMLNY